MPLFGVNDVLFLLASTSALLWVKRGEIVSEVLPTRPRNLEAYEEESDCPGDVDGMPSRRVVESRLCSNPRLLLGGFDLDGVRRGECAMRMRSGASGEETCLNNAMEQAVTVGSLRPSSSLVRTSVANGFADTPLVPDWVPNVPHRSYHSVKRLPHVSSLATSTEAEVKQSIRRYSLAEVHALFAKMEAECLWEGVVTVSRGIEAAGAQLAYLTQRNVEAALRTLFAASKADLALAYYLAYGVDMLPSDEIVVGLVDGARHMDKVAAQVCHALLPFQDRWSPAVYACCLTTAARIDLPLALRLYDAYERRVAHAEQDRARAHQRASSSASSSGGGGGSGTPLRGGSALARVLASPSLLLAEGGLAADNTAGEAASLVPRTGAPAAEAGLAKLQNLYHVIIPLTLEKQPERAQRYVADMMRREPESAPDVFLQSLWSAEGRRLATAYLAHVRAGHLNPDKSLISSVRDTWHTERRPSCTPSLLNGRTAVEVAPPVTSLSELALGLYECGPSAMNMNTLLRLLMNAPAHADVSGDDPGGTGRSLPYDPELARVAQRGSPRLTDLFARVPLPAGDVDAAILARALTERQTQWAVAAQFLTAMMQRRRFCVVPTLATHLARQGQWDTVARAMSIYLSNQRSAMTVPEVQLCVEASVRSGRWSSALFWVERANNHGLVLPPAVYDAALSVSPHCRWEASARVLRSIRDAGGTCSQRGVLHVLEAAANQGTIAKALDALAGPSGGIVWTP